MPSGLKLITALVLVLGAAVVAYFAFVSPPASSSGASTPGGPSPVTSPAPKPLPSAPKPVISPPKPAVSTPPARLAIQPSSNPAAEGPKPVTRPVTDPLADNGRSAERPAVNPDAPAPSLGKGDSSPSTLPLHEQPPIQPISQPGIQPGIRPGIRPGTAPETVPRPVTPAVSTPSPTPVRPASTAGNREHTVAKGETMSSIAANFYGDASKWTVISKANPLVDPEHMKIGMKLAIPPAPAAPSVTVPKPAAPSAPAPATPLAPAGGSIHTVVAGDTLIGLSRRYYNNDIDWDAIFDANTRVLGEDPANLRVGMKLVIPKKPS